MLLDLIGGPQIEEVMSITGLQTRKQCWRRQSRSSNRKIHDLLYNEVRLQFHRIPLYFKLINLWHLSFQGIGIENGNYRTRSKSEPIFSDLQTISQVGRLWATTENLISQIDKRIVVKVVAKKKVRFQSLVRVVLIPSRYEYADANLFDSLWWEDSDYTVFKASALLELNAMMASPDIRDSLEAIKMLYQPCYEENNFSRPEIDSFTVPRSNPVSCLNYNWGTEYWCLTE